MILNDYSPLRRKATIGYCAGVLSDSSFNVTRSVPRTLFSLCDKRFVSLHEWLKSSGSVAVSGDANAKIPNLWDFDWQST